MNVSFPPVEVKVWGPFACFTRPENKVERVSYDVPTPSAARGVLEAIFFHPPMKWRVREIVVLNEIKRFSIVRNEVKSKASKRGDGISIIDDRTQRHTLGLRDVAYIIRADVWLPNEGAREDIVKYRDQFRRRVERGQCYHRPYLGCREFAACFGPPDGFDTPIAETSDLGLMLFGIRYGEDFGEKQNRALFFHARLERGILHIPYDLYNQTQGIRP